MRPAGARSREDAYQAKASWKASGWAHCARGTEKAAQWAGQSCAQPPLQPGRGTRAAGPQTSTWHTFFLDARRVKIVPLCSHRFRWSRCAQVGTPREVLTGSAPRARSPCPMCRRTRPRGTEPGRRSIRPRAFSDLLSLQTEFSTQLHSTSG